MKPKILIESQSPMCPIRAFVEQDDNVAYFYLFSKNENFGLKSCWLRNIAQTPQEISLEDMQNGIPSLLNAEYCTQQSNEPLKSNELEIIWFEECDGAALLERGEILAIIPSWSGSKDFWGYSRDCKGDSKLCWGLGTPETNVLFRRVKRSINYWKLWNGDLWSKVQNKYLNTLENKFGKSKNYYAIDGGNWPPKALVRFFNQKHILCTMGLSLIAQPKIEDDNLKRIELAISLDPSYSEEDIKKLGVYISGQSSLSWNQITWLGDGHTLSCDCLPESKYGSEFKYVFLIKNFDNEYDIKFDSFLGDNINVLWMIPITENEKKYAIEHGSNKLKEKLNENNVSLLFKDRKEVV